MKRVVWITGASSGIGRALALEWARRGAEDGRGRLTLVLSARRKNLLDAWVAEIRSKFGAQGVEAGAVELDLERPESFPAIVARVLKEYGAIDVLVNNAGLSQRSLALETKFEVYERLLRVNALGTITLTQEVLPHLVGRDGAQIVTISSVAGKFGTPYRTGYSAAKHALQGYCDSLRAETARAGLTVTVLCPGFVQTDVSRNALTGTGAALGTVDETLEGAMTAEEFAVRAMDAILARREEAVIGGAKERFAVLLKRFAPRIFSKMIVNAKVR